MLLSELVRFMQVDETLFGSASSTARRRKAAAARASREAAVVSQAVLEKLKQDPKTVHPRADAVVLTPAELRRIQDSAVPGKRFSIGGPEQPLSKQEKAAARKARMKKFDESRKKKNTDLSDLQLEDVKHAKSVLKKAEQIRSEQMDQVKNMNQMVLYAQCVAVRDQQLKEKKTLAEKMKHEEERLDLMMEKDRVAGVKREAERGRQREEERKAGAKVIVAQMEHNEKERMLEKERIHQEGLKMVQRIKEMDEEERQKQIEAQKRAKLVFAEVVKANQAQADTKKAQIMLEKEEDNRIAAYLQAKDKMEREREARLEEEKAAKEMEIARLRAKQEKAKDQQAEEDAVRARRAQEESERRWRKNELRKKEEKIRQIRELAEAREAQRVQKDRRMKQMAKEEKRVFKGMVRAFKKDFDERQRIEEHVRNVRLQAKEELQKQIEEKDCVKKKERDDLMKESERMKMETELELRKLAVIKQNKLDMLRSQGVPEKYCAELARKKIIIS